MKEHVMGREADAILTEALGLPAAERADLAEKLLASLDERERAAVDARWAEEAERRLEAYEAGRLEAVAGEEVLKRVRGPKR